LIRETEGPRNGGREGVGVRTREGCPLPGGEVQRANSPAEEGRDEVT